MKKYRTVTAVFGGVCAATGKRYPKGTPLILTPKGWIIAPSSLTEDYPAAKPSPAVRPDNEEEKPCAN